MSDSQDGDLARVSDELPTLLSEARVPGLSVAIVREAKVTWAASYGLASLRPVRNVATDTVFQAASLSKPLFAYAVLGLVERGILDLETPLSAYVPDSYMSDDPQIATITARHVLCHTTGWPNWRSKSEPFVRRHASGEVFSYSGEGYVYLQKVVEHLTGQPLDVFMREAVLDPLGLVSSNYRWPASDDPVLAKAHDDDGRPTKPYSGDGPEAASSLHTTASDFARFLCAMLESPRLPNLPSIETPYAMLQPQIRLGDALAWGLGWGLEDTDLGPAFWHWGDNPGYKSIALALPALGTGIVVMTNGDNGLSLCDYLVRTIAGDGHPAFRWLAETFYGVPTLAAIYNA